MNGVNYLKGVEMGSEVSIFNFEGKLLEHFNADSDLVLLNSNGATLVKVKTKYNISVIKTKK